MTITERLDSNHYWSIDVPSREIFLHRYIHEESETEGDCGVDYRMSVQFIKNLRFLDRRNSNKRILIHMQSRGGDWNDGMAIYDAIIACKSKVHIIAYAHARSMTSIILQAADKRILAPNCDVVVHKGFLAFGEDRQTPIISAIEYEKKIDKKMLKIYAGRCKSGKAFIGKSEKQIIRYITNKMKDKTDWIMSANDAIHYGFADKILTKKDYK